MTTTRDAFEAWFTKARGYATTCKTADGGFEWVAASEAWEAWQAATLAERERIARMLKDKGLHGLVADVIRSSK